METVKAAVPTLKVSWYIRLQNATGFKRIQIDTLYNIHTTVMHSKCDPINKNLTKLHTLHIKKYNFKYSRHCLSAAPGRQIYCIRK